MTNQQELKNLKTKVVLITGASSGLGKTLGSYLVQKGFIVYGTSRNPDQYPDIKDYQLLKLDLSDDSSIKKAVEIIIEKEGRLDILVNNAGTGITGPIEEIPDEEIEQNFKTNCFGPIKVSKAVIPQMRKQNQGLILNITSIAAYMGLPFRGIYSASKAALEITTEAWRMELRDFNIQMTSLAPGDFVSDIASRRFHSPLIDGSPYEEKYGQTLKMIDDHVEEGKDPLGLAKKVYQIIKEPDPKPHYKFGAFMQKFSIVLKKLLPQKTYESLLINHYNLK